MNDIIKLNIKTPDELLRIYISRAAYFQVDDYYTIVYYNTDLRIYSSLSLTTFQAVFIQKDKPRRRLVRLWRQYITKTDQMIRITSTQSKLYLTVEQGNTYTVPLFKPVSEN